MMNELEQMSVAWVVLIKEQLKLFTLEAKLAKMSFVPASLCACLLFMLCLSALLCALAFAGYLVFYYTSSLMISIGAVLIVNIGLVGSAYLLLKRYLRRMSFRYTRAQLDAYNKQLEQAD